MAMHAGVVYFDGRPTDVDRRWLAASVRPIAPDGLSLFAQDGVVIGYGACEVWSGGAGGRLVEGDSGLVVAWDGRLDNRDDLMLRLHGRLSRELSDADIVLAAVERWGVDGFRSLVGDWSTALWDASRRTLHLARDYMGVRPLYYCLDRESVMWSSSLAELATRSGRVCELDDGFVAQFMALRSSTDVTPYVDIRGVPTATCVSIERGRERRRRFWTLDPVPIRYRDAGQYEEHLRALWLEAVGARLRCAGPVCAELSGGLDSSAIVCAADALVRSGAVEAPAVRPFSHVTLQSPEGDERRFILEVEAKTGVCSHILGVEEHQLLRDRSWEWVTPLAVEGVQVASIRHVRNQGSRVVLSGRLGDLVMGCTPDNSVAVFDDLADWNLVAAAVKLRRWSRACRAPLIELAYELAAGALRAQGGWPRRPSLTESQRAGLDLLVDRLRGPTAERDGRSDHEAVRLAKRPMHAWLSTVARHAQLEVHSGAFDVHYTYPYSHRPLVEFMLAIPGEQVSAPGELRALMRRAFAGLVPAKVLQRISKGYYPPALLRATRSLAASLLPAERAGVVRRGWVDANRLEESVRRLAAGGTRDGGELQRVMRLEQWLTSRDRWGPTAMPQGKEVTTNDVLIA